MGHRSIILLIGALCTFVATNVSALGLGKITLDSALNQPLKGQIELFEVRELTKEEIRVQIASREDFDRIGIDKTYFLSDLKFEVILDGAGAPYIIVTSTKLVREPFINFLIQVQWPSGKLLREYTLLMDLPVFSNEAAPSVQTSSSAPSTQTSQPAQQAAATAPASSSSYNPRSSYEQAPPRPTAQEVSPTYTDDSYQVRANDTLWEIAASVRPNRSVSIHQTMIAIQRENPEAFINNNINLLKSGQILRIPDQDDMADLVQREAVREVAVQNAAWSGDDEVSGAQLSGSSLYDDTEEDASEPEGRLSLSSPDDAFDSSEGRTSGSAADSSTEALENELAITMEQLDKSSRENSDLRSKVSSLEEQIETMERMVEVSNESLRALELAAKKNVEEADAALEDDAYTSTSDELDASFEDDSLVEDSTTESALEENTFDDEFMDEESIGAELEGANADELASNIDDLDISSDDSSELSEGAVDDVVSEEAVATPAPTPKIDAKKVVIAPPQPEKGIVDIILENILYIVAGIVILAGGAFFIVRQKSADEDEFDDFMQQHGLDDAESIDAPSEESSDGDDIDLGDFDGGDEPIAEESVEEDAEDAESEAQTEDVVTEADIYIAYGRFDRAEEMLLKALSSDPSDQDVRLKLLEVYSSQGDAERFDPHYAKLRAFASPSILERADTLRQGIPHIAAFDEASFDVSDVSKFSEGDGETSPVSEVDEGGFEASLDAEDDLSTELDTDLSLDSLDLGDSDTEESDDLSLDIDLGDLDSDGDPDSAFDLDLPDEEETTATSLDFSGIEETNTESDELGDLDLDFDLEGDTDEAESLDLDIALGDEEVSSENVDSDVTDDALTLEDGLDFDLGDASDDELASDLSLELEADPEAEQPSGANDNLDDLDLDLASDETGADLGDSLEADLASLDADLDLGELDLGDLDLGDEDTAVTEDVADLAPADATVDFDLEADLGSLDEETLDLGSEESSVGSDTVVNEALNDEYIEQKLSEDIDVDMDFDEILPLEAEQEEAAPVDELTEAAPVDELTEAAPVDELTEADENADDDLDLSSLDEELDALTANVPDEQPADVSTADMEEPVTDFEDFEDDLEKDEANAETVKSDHVAEKPVEEMGEDTMFDQAIQEVPEASGSDVEFDLPEVNPDDVDDDDLDFLSDSDETATKLDLARAYIDMGDQEGARDIIREVMNEGNDQQKSEAESLLGRLDG
ncbi:MAG: hypothetical protein K6L80_05690 [Agarilytica sp.]